MNTAKRFILGILFAYVYIPTFTLPLVYKVLVTGPADGAAEAAVTMDGFTRFARTLTGTGPRADLLLNILGLCIIAYTAGECRNYKKSFDKIRLCAVITAAAACVFLVAPYFMTGKNLFVLAAGLNVCMLAMKTVILVLLARSLQSLTDDYVHMEVYKDLQFGAELYGFFIVIGFFWQFFRNNTVMNLLWILYVAGAMAAIVYYIWKVYGYSRKLNLFSEDNIRRDRVE